MTAIRPLVALVVGLASAVPASAQTTVTRSETAATGKAVRLVVVPNLRKDCSAGPLPEIKVTTAPRNGSLITKAGKTKTPASYRCPNQEAAVQAVFYQSNAGFTGPDEVTVEIKNADGAVQTQNFRITVDAAGKAGDGKAGTEL